MIAWEERGPAGGPPVVLLHSLGLDRRMWEPEVAAWERRRRMILVDLRGHGRSAAPPGEYVIGELGEDVLRAADEAGLDRFDVCGVSLGGLTALWLAIEHPERLRSLVVSNSAAKIATAEIWAERKAFVEARGIAGIREAALLRWFTPNVAEAVRARLAGVLDETSAVGYAACCALLRDADLRSAVPKIRAPALFVAGAGDTATPPSDARWLHGQVAGSRYAEISETAHLPSCEAPERWLREVDAFLG